MGDWATSAKVAVSYTAQVGASVWRLGKAIGNFNYQFISALFRLVAEAWSALCVFGMALGSASCEIVIYVFEFLVEFGRFLHVVLRLLAQLVIAFLHIALWLYRILEQVTAVIADLLLHTLRWLGGVMNDLLDYLGVSACSAVNSLKSVTYACSVWSLSTSYYIIECLKSFVEASFDYSCHGLSAVYLFAEECLQQMSCSCLNILRIVNAELIRLWEISWNYLNTSIPQFVSVFSSKDVYLTIALIISVIVLLQIIVTVFRNNGLTVPFFGRSGVSHRINHRIIIDWDNASDGFIFVSDEEDDVEADEQMENDEESDHESVRTGTNTSHANDDSSDLDETSEDSTASYADEFEIADDSDFESGDENNQNAINIQLPQRTVQYGLRPRITPSPARSFTKLSQNELEKYLETERDKRLCVVCQDNAKNVLVLPCKHMCMCVTCARYLVTNASRARRVCPLCRSRIDTVMDVFL